MDFSPAFLSEKGLEIERICYDPEGPAVRFYLSATKKPSPSDQASCQKELEDYLSCPVQILFHVKKEDGSKENGQKTSREDSSAGPAPSEPGEKLLEAAPAQPGEKSPRETPAQPGKKLSEEAPLQASEGQPEETSSRQAAADDPMDSYYEQPMIIEKKKENSNEPGGSSSPQPFSRGRMPKSFYRAGMDLSQFGVDSQKDCKAGFVEGLNFTLTRKKKLIVSFDLVDREGAACACKAFFDEKDQADFEENLHNGDYVLLRGRDNFDQFSQEFTYFFSAIRQIQAQKMQDPAPEKRVEFAIHTHMSAMQGIIEPDSLLKRLKDWGHDFAGIADLSSVQAYPEIDKAFKKSGIQALYGCQMKILRDDHKILSNYHQLDFSSYQDKYTIFDLETTGLSRFQNRIIEIGAVRYEGGKRVGEFSRFVNPGLPIPEKITKLTSITDDMVRDADPIEKVLPDFLEFSKGSIYVGHNADFDVGFIAENARNMQIPFAPVFLDTLGLSRALHPEYKNFKLDTLAKNLKIPAFHHHRAIDDAKATAEVFFRLMEEWEQLGMDLREINQTPSDYPLARHESNQLLIYVKNQSGLKSLYKLLSDASIHYFWRTPGIPESQLQAAHDQLLFVSGFIGSELFEAVAQRLPDSILLEAVKKVDVVCVQAPAFASMAAGRHLCRDEEHYKEIVEKEIALAKQAGKPCIAVGMPDYLDPKDRLARNILVNYERYRDFDENERGRFLNTGEMLQAFSWLGRKKAYELVVTATRKLAAEFEEVSPIPQGTFTPNLKGADEELQTMVMENAHKIYGDPLPEIVDARLKRELHNIISNGYASLYVIAERLVKKSNADGYVVGSRGSVGSSLVACMMGITEVNSLVPHYICPHCKHSEFITDGSYDSGFDLPRKNCPECGRPMQRNGHTIPFEVFLGFNGDKEPDIDLNFAGQYMPTIHKYTETLFGKGKVYRAGTISVVKEKTAYGFIHHYLEDDYIPAEDHDISKARIRSLVRTMIGTRRTTGQHAGGLMIVPQTMDIYDFCPIQYPADDVSSDVQTTHFSYKYLSGHMLKLDELGHTSPTVLRQLQEMTGINPLEIEFDDPETMALFSSAKSLHALAPYSNAEDGSLGIPEFGTGFVRGMLKETRPKTFAELIRISGLSHGTNVWLGNAQELIHQGVTDLTGCICTRDDIMTYLIMQGMDKLESFKIMESVRHGRGIPEELIPHMHEAGIAQWYIDSCQKISYMFPKAHAAAYVMMSYRIAWFKVHYPAAFYASAFTQRLSAFESSFLFKSLEECQQKMEMLKEEETGMEGAESEGLSEENLSGKYALLELIEEMLARGLHFAPLDLNQSLATDFTSLDEKTILPPFAALDGVSEANGQALVEEREKGEFFSRTDLRKRTGLTKKALQSMDAYGLLDALPVSNQMSFFAGF